MNSESLHSIDLNLLKALDALLDELSVTQAAKRLAVTQPAVSNSLKRLRETFNDPLFIRGQHELIPTLRAQELRLPIKNLLNDARQLFIPQHFDPSTTEMTLTIAATDYSLAVVVLPFIIVLRKAAPNIKVVTINLDHSRLQQQLESGHVDLVVDTPSMLFPDLHNRKLFDEHYLCIMREQHPLSGMQLTLNSFCEAQHGLVSPEKGQLVGITDEVLASLGKERQVVVSLSSFLGLVDLVRRTDLLATVPSRLAGSQGIIACQPPLSIPGFSKFLYWHARTHHDQAHRWIRDIFYRSLQ